MALSLERTHDPRFGGSQSVYAAVSGWTYDDMEVDGMTYTLIMVGEQPVGGMCDVGDDPEFDAAPVQ